MTAVLADVPTFFRPPHLLPRYAVPNPEESGDFVLGLVDGLISGPFLGLAFDALAASAGIDDAYVGTFANEEDEDDLSLSSDSPPASPADLPLASPWPQVPRACHLCGNSSPSQWWPGPLGRDTLCESCGAHWLKSEAVGGLGRANPLKASPSGPLSLPASRPANVPPAAPILLPPPRQRLARTASRDSSALVSPPLSPPRHDDSAPSSPTRRPAACSSASSAASVPSVARKPGSGVKRGREAEGSAAGEEPCGGSVASDGEGAAAAATDKLYCHFCGTRCTSQWRKGPHGINTLCNACGLRWKRKGANASSAYPRPSRAVPDADGDL